YRKKGWDEADIREYISDMIGQFKKTDLIVSRAGATTSAELAAGGKAAIMVPLPTAADDHQRKNAEALVANGSARMVLQKDLNGEALAKLIIEFIESPEKIEKMEKAARKLAKRDAAEKAVDLIEDLSSEA
ncbi:MAG: UDP-N-acetylglucosamine--N-acetylmuramyl-(pentapeptide) pyrophosphoryl-undecaprenol N-acetylglucosamine transferase, partial [Acidobacteriota bacterium]|nr:UDP-N-acetylglucosamine--N-acetylmuramyl-(pentapeptide) pyrophosphoryl-undecaprenol N-acetylglucosamine transferase [Acidobacteriota bacterium]